MRFFTILPLCLLINASIARADSVSPFFGKWKAEWQTEKKMEEAHFVLDEKGGTWQTLARARHNPCVGHEARIQIEKSSPNAMILKLKFSEAISGCADATVHLKRIDDKNISGRRGNTELILTRE